MPRATGGVQKANAAFRKTSAGMKLGKLIFDPATQANISPALISSLLRQAGIPLSKNAEISLASAQLIMSGGALVNGIEQGKTISQLSGVSLNMARATLGLLDSAGLMDSSSPAGLMVQTALDGALVLSSGGLNILADIAFVLDLFAGFVQAFGIGTPSFEELYQAEMRAAQSRANAHFNSIVAPEAKAAASVFQDYHAGKLSVFSMLGKVAEAAPDLFPTYFPEQAVFFPQITERIIAPMDLGKLNMWKLMDEMKKSGGNMKLYASKEWQALSDTSRATLQWSIAKAMLMPLIDKYRMQAVMSEKWSVISVIDVAVLSMIPKYFQHIGPDFDIVPILKHLSLTPEDMGYDMREVKGHAAIEASNRFISRTWHESAITFNGVDYIRPGVAPSDKLTTVTTVRRKEAQEIYKTWGQWKSRFNIRDFWAIVSMAESMLKDPYYNDAIQTGVRDQVDSILKYEFGDYSQHISERHRDLQFLSVARKLNFKARLNVADFFGVPVGKLKLAPIEAGQVAKVLH